MTRHVLDHRSPSEGERVKQFVEIARRAGAEEAHPTIRALSERSREAGAGQRLAEFLRIQRGWTV